ncbi:sugar phosphorylase [Mesorhizobium xinjiangense]|uniref:sugar phosphorylase n=1 Tax=Mesorhizobium xinjiangense TaxID=2678685 RepID=UPI0012ED133D|nr:sugar phosphorylase [Mesorhizobium xinjiangense]
MSETVYPSQLSRKVKAHLAFIYPDRDAEALSQKVLEAFWPKAEQIRPKARRASAPPWSERDSVLITYGNSLIDGVHPPLTLLHHFMNEHLKDAISSLHVLPFFPWTSDDGFAVVDYLKVNSDLGSWDHLSRLGADYRLMADLVLNHVSSSSAWFTQFLQDQEPGWSYFVTADPNADLSAVVRPRPFPLLRAVETPSGERHVWCTFSHDQIDVDFANPDLLSEFIRIMRFHIDRGVRTIRLDAVAFIWKEIGTPCIHHPRTHEIVRLMRTLADYAAEPLVLITETNVPNFENLSYFGNRNEAHAVYNFSFPPLMLHALLYGDASLLNAWQMRMPPAPLGCFFFNFLASHDGIGLRPAEGYLDDAAIAEMIDTVRGFGGRVSMRSTAEGTERPYEINVALFDALKGTAQDGEDGLQFERFICSQTVMMALEGIPAFYIHSLLATPNDHERVARMGYSRSINRHQWDYPALEELLSDPESVQSRVLGEMLRRIRIRTSQPAFHPNATQYTLQLGPAFFGLWRQSLDREQSIFAIHNVTTKPQPLALVTLNMIAGEQWVELLEGRPLDVEAGQLVLEPYQCAWITNRPKRPRRSA